MSALKSLLLLSAAAFSSFATSITLTSTQNPADIPGGAAPYQVFSATLSQPTSPGGLWTLTIDMNYGGPVVGNEFEDYTGPGGFVYGPGDFLIEQTVGTVTTDYGIPLGDHADPVTGTPTGTYVPGNLYKIGGTGSFTTGEGFLTSGPTLGNNAGSVFPLDTDTPDAGFYTWLANGGTQIAAGNLTITDTGTGPDPTLYMYTVTDTFNASAGFLGTDDPFTVYLTSAICANGTLTGTGSFPPPSTVPEPRSLTLSASALMLLGFAAFRRRSRSF
ncbi:MAG: hypothetical protein ABSB35_33775 [Bryobacteraceae bacterium]|jgi:hypothetical protein